MCSMLPRSQGRHHACIFTQKQHGQFVFYCVFNGLQHVLESFHDMSLLQEDDSALYGNIVFALVHSGPRVIDKTMTSD